jgi:beta-glucosidase
MSFPKNFAWGAAAASYQIEGATTEDGRSDCVWDTYARRKDAIWKSHNADVACDHYHRWKEDVALMKQIGLPAYRLSLAWPRILPGGTGQVNAKGLAFYDKLIDELLAAGVEPWVTLFHWDMPQILFDRGGWLNRESADWFAAYAAVVADKLSDRVTHWITLNEPQCYILFGMRDAFQAPGLKLSRSEYLRAGHHTLLAHGQAVKALRAHAKKPCEIGWAAVGWSKIPATNSPADIEAARYDTFNMREGDILDNAFWMDPVYLGHYPEQTLKFLGADAPQPQPGDLETICQKLDFQGFNTYNGTYIRAGKGGLPEVVPHPAGYTMNSFYGAVTPECLYWTSKFMAERYKLPVVITENGMGTTDAVSVDGKVHDPQRINYIQRYLLELERAGAEGVKLRGYFVWSIIDNFEWSEGYKHRLGLIYCDYIHGGKRIIKDSGYWYQKVAASNGAHLHEPWGV